jgi:NADH-quinone oxidoreductase subunit L
LVRWPPAVIFHDHFDVRLMRSSGRQRCSPQPTTTSLHDFHGVPIWVKLAPFVAMIVGFLVSYQFYIRDPSAPVRLAERNRGLYQFLLNKWYFDELYDFLFVRPAKRLGYFLWKKGDAVIDGLGPDGVSRASWTSPTAW